MHHNDTQTRAAGPEAVPSSIGATAADSKGALALLHAQLDSWARHPGPDATDADRIARDTALAHRVLAAIPCGFVLPAPMRCDAGTLGMYWDREDDYADLEVDADGTVSLFVRQRSSGTGHFVEGVDVNALDAAFFARHLVPFGPVVAAPAPAPSSCTAAFGVTGGVDDAAELALPCKGRQP